MNRLLGASIPPISQDTFNELDKAFRAIEIVPNVTTLEEIMHNAGQRTVVEWLRTKVRSSTITGSMP